MASDRPRSAASVILVRPRGGGSSGALEVLLLRRHQKASFMRNAFVFPGGAADEGEKDPRETAARELFEEAGVLLCDGELDAGRREALRRKLRAGEGAFRELLAAEGVALELGALRYFAHWVTPSIEKKRFSARFYLAALPGEQEVTHDAEETVDQIWVTPEEALERAGELCLPPPQVHTFSDMREAAARGLGALWDAAREREDRPHPILPRLCQEESGVSLLLPWDPEYEERGTGECISLPPDHPLARGPSRFVLEGGAWRNVFAPEGGEEA